MKRICVDCGHNSVYSGASSFGLREEDVVLNIGLKLGNILKKQGLDAIYTRIDKNKLADTNAKDLMNRCEIANKAKCDYFVSIHNNSFSDPNSNGIETLVYDDKNEDTYGLANSVQGELIKATELRDRGVKVRPDLCVLRNTKMSAILCEINFISNKAENDLLKSDEYLMKCAIAIAKGIMSHVGMEYKEEDKVEKEIYWRVVVASNKDIEESRKLVQKLQGEGYTNAFIVKCEKE